MISRYNGLFSLLNHGGMMLWYSLGCQGAFTLKHIYAKALECIGVLTRSVLARLHFAPTNRGWPQPLEVRTLDAIHQSSSRSKLLYTSRRAPAQPVDVSLDRSTC